MGDVPIKYACSAPKCGASTKNMIQLFSFPSHKDPNRLKWCRKFRTLRNDRKWTPGFCDRVCMAHFANECFALGTEYYDKVCTQGCVLLTLEEALNTKSGDIFFQS